MFGFGGIAPLILKIFATEAQRRPLIQWSLNCWRKRSLYVFDRKIFGGSEQVWQSRSSGRYVK